MIPFLFFLCCFTTADDPVWPPKGPQWEIDPIAAFEKAHKENKAVFVYIASAG